MFFRSSNVSFLLLQYFPCVLRSTSLYLALPRSTSLYLPPSLTYMCRAGAIGTDDTCVVLKVSILISTWQTSFYLPAEAPRPHKLFARPLSGPFDVACSRWELAGVIPPRNQYKTYQHGMGQHSCPPFKPAVDVLTQPCIDMSGEPTWRTSGGTFR